MYGKNDTIKNGASPELGKAYAECITGRLATLACAMPDWDADTRAAFIDAERALVSAQVRGWRETAAWHAWQKPEAMKIYGPRLIEGDFEAIKEMAGELV